MPIGPTWFAPSSKRERNACMSSTEVRGRWSGTCGHWDCVPILMRHSNPKIHTNCRYFYEWSCTPTLRIIPSTQKPGTMPHLNPFWRGDCHGLASCLLPTRSVGAYLALCHVASHWVQTRSDHPTGAGPAQAPQYHRDQTVRGSDAKTALRPV